MIKSIVYLFFSVVLLSSCGSTFLSRKKHDLKLVKRESREVVSKHLNFSKQEMTREKLDNCEQTFQTVANLKSQERSISTKIENDTTKKISSVVANFIKKEVKRKKKKHETARLKEKERKEKLEKEFDADKHKMVNCLLFGVFVFAIAAILMLILGFLEIFETFSIAALLAAVFAFFALVFSIVARKNHQTVRQRKLAGFFIVFSAVSVGVLLWITLIAYWIETSEFWNTPLPSGSYF